MLDRLALIIANNEFDDPKLTRLVTPGRDAAALAAVLRDPAIGDFDVTILTNETMQVVRREIARLYQRRKKGDLLLLYYSGHGIKDDHGDLYLAVKNVEVDLVSATAIDAAFVRRQLDQSHSQRKVVILDCCYSGAFASGAKAALGSSAGTQETLAGNGYGRVILTASNAVEYAWEGNWLWGEPDETELSLFTHFLVQGLRTGAADLDGDGQISLDELYEYVYEQVMTSGRAKQTPQKSVPKIEGRIIIARNLHRVVRPAELQSELHPSLTLKLAVKPPTGTASDEVTWIITLHNDGDDDLRHVTVRRGRMLLDDPFDLAAGKRRRFTFTTTTTTTGPKTEKVTATGIASNGTTVRRDTSATVSVRLAASKPEPVPGHKPSTQPALDIVTITAPIHLELVRVSAGEFLIGSDKKNREARDNEQPQHPIHVSEFYMGRYPLTNKQYAAFVRATGHKVPNHWKEGKIPLGRETHPVVNVSWHDARAFCEWLSREIGQDFRLPTEAEWEKAASWDERAGQKQQYPWGNEFDKAKCNTSESEIGNTTPVGQYSPDGDSPYGCADMAGNVWEWTSSLGKAYPYQASDGREDLESSGLRMLRGGSFLNSAWFARVTCRNPDLPDARYWFRGCRICAVAHFSPDSEI